MEQGSPGFPESLKHLVVAAGNWVATQCKSCLRPLTRPGSGSHGVNAVEVQSPASRANGLGQHDDYTKEVYRPCMHVLNEIHEQCCFFEVPKSSFQIRFSG